MENGSLPKRYIKKHAESFKNGASRIVTRSSYDDYGVGKPDLGKSEFVVTKDDASIIISKTGGNPIAISKILGLDPEQLQGDSLVIIEFKPTELYSPKTPSGREWGEPLLDGYPEGNYLKGILKQWSILMV